MNAFLFPLRPLRCCPSHSCNLGKISCANVKCHVFSICVHQRNRRSNSLCFCLLPASFLISVILVCSCKIPSHRHLVAASPRCALCVKLSVLVECLLQ